MSTALDRARRARGAARGAYPPPGRQGQSTGYNPVPTGGGGQRRSVSSTGTLKVLVQSASGLKKGDLYSSDPYAIVSISGQDKRTRVQRKTLKPGAPPPGRPAQLLAHMATRRPADPRAPRRLSRLSRLCRACLVRHSLERGARLPKHAAGLRDQPVPAARGADLRRGPRRRAREVLEARPAARRGEDLARATRRRGPPPLLAEDSTAGPGTDRAHRHVAADVATAAGALATPPRATAAAQGRPAHADAEAGARAGASEANPEQSRGPQAHPAAVVVVVVRSGRARPAWQAAAAAAS